MFLERLNSLKNWSTVLNFQKNDCNWYKFDIFEKNAPKKGQKISKNQIISKRDLYILDLT